MNGLCEASELADILAKHGLELQNNSKVFEVAPSFVWNLRTDN